MAGELWTRGATEICQLIRNKEVTAEEAVEAHVRRIESVNPTLHAVVVPLFDHTVAEA